MFPEKLSEREKYIEDQVTTRKTTAQTGIRGDHIIVGSLHIHAHSRSSGWHPYRDERRRHRIVGRST